jgi:hypothetical protein
VTEDSYAANGVKHCVRPADMTGKSAVVLLRRIHPKLLTEALSMRMDALAEHYDTMHLRDEDWPPLPSKLAEEATTTSKAKRTISKRARVYANDHERAAAEALTSIVNSICSADRYDGCKCVLWHVAA